MRTLLLATAALTLAACGNPAAPAETPAPAAMDPDMKAADAADDANTAETPDGYMFHTDTAKTESVHLPVAAGATWTATVADATQAEIVGAKDETMADGSTHHVVQVKPLKRDVIAKVKFERRDSADTSAPVVETRTVNFMVH